MASDSANITLTEREAMYIAVMLEDRIITNREHLDRYKAQGGREEGWGLAMDMCSQSIDDAQAVIRKIDRARARPRRIPA